MILGLGIDLFPVARLERELERWGAEFLEEFSSRAELRLARDLDWTPARTAAGFAGKEAVFKMLGTGRTPQMSWKEIEILPRLNADSRANLFAVYGPNEADPVPGNAQLLLHGAVLESARTLGIGRITLELEFSGSHVLAIAIAESGLRPGDAPPSPSPRSDERTEPLVKGGLS